MIDIIDSKKMKELTIKHDTMEQHAGTVKEIIEQVKLHGDNALNYYTERFDKAKLTNIAVTKEEIENAYNEISDDVLASLQEAIHNIRKYHEQQTRNTWITTSEYGSMLGQISQPLERVGVYVPGGTASYPSSVLMNVIPAQVAGVKEIIITTPCNEDGKINDGVLVAANELGIEEIYKVGGAQAVAALAFGTRTIKKVDKITGPGNIFVALAKKEVFGTVDIDMIAGPSDVTIVADETANIQYIAADLLAQAEHDVLSSANLVTPSPEVAVQVKRELHDQIKDLPRKEIIKAALQNHSKICIVQDIEEAFEIINVIAPEHLQVMLANPMEYINKIKNAGAIFLGDYSPTAVGDYFAGPSHVLPTEGTAKYSSPLNVDDFLKKSSLVYYSETEMKENADKIMTLANYEKLHAHAKSVELRLK